jgi:hypothetical protein
MFSDAVFAQECIHGVRAAAPLLHSPIHTQLAIIGTMKENNIIVAICVARPMCQFFSVLFGPWLYSCLEVSKLQPVV